MNKLKTLTQGIVMYLCVKYEVSTPVQVGRILMSHTHARTRAHTHTDGEIDMAKNITYRYPWMNITEAKSSVWGIQHGQSMLH